VNKATVLAAFFSVAALVACSSSPPPQLVLDPIFASGESLAVSGHTNRTWGKPLRFGGYSTRETRVGETWVWSAGTFDVGAGVRTQPYRFVFVGERGDEWQVECRARTPVVRHSDDHGAWEFPLAETRLGCAMRDAAERVGTLALAGNGVEFSGGLAAADVEPIEIRGLGDVRSHKGHTVHLPGVFGYELSQGGRPVGSVDLLGDGRVHFAAGLSPEVRDQVAMAAAVLMFFGEA
jgi:hypothetical protein